MNEKRYLIVNADDFGQSSGVNEGIIEAHQRGIVTSASLMVRWPAVEAAVTYAQDHADLSLGLHIDIGEWAYRNQQWVTLYEVVPTDNMSAVREEVERQLEMFYLLAGKSPTHIDSHQHQHLRGPLQTVLRDVADRLAVPLRHYSEDITYCGAFYGQTAKGEPLHDAISVRNLMNILETLAPGFTELGCHPGKINNLNTMYFHERAQELNALCHPLVRASLVSMEIELRSFLDITIEV